MLRRSALLSLAFALLSCETGPPPLSWRAGDERTADPNTATLWVSYQIEIAKIDGRDAGLRAPGRCVYYRVAAPPGLHDLDLRLRYKSPLEEVRSKPATLQVRLEAGREYRLLDLAAGTRGQRNFTPWLQPGAPPRGSVEAAIEKK